MHYQDAAAYLDSLQFFTIKLGLATTRELLAEVGNPQDQLHIIHLAGTNGKGSVGASLLAILNAAGYRTGLYTSPHLSSVRERFVLNGRYISEDEFAQLMTQLRALFAAKPAPPTYFECTTLLALLWFARKQAEIVILETGMGGRLDATNVVTPLVSVLTDISLDHQQYLGDDLASIAGEKAGIIKAGVPVVCSSQPAPALAVIKEVCRMQQSPLRLLGQDFQANLTTSKEQFDYQGLAGTHHQALPLKLKGQHQLRNLAVALATLESLPPDFTIPSAAIRTGLAQVHWPGRLEELHLSWHNKPRQFLLDGAHNEAGVTALHQALEHDFPRKRLLLIWGNMADKQVAAPLLALLPLVDVLVLTQAEPQRSAPAEAIRAQLPPTLNASVLCTQSVEQALEQAMEQAAPEDLICIAGSLYLVGRARFLLVGELAL